MKDYYKILELEFGANDDDIKKSYRYLAQKFHPDKNFGNKKHEELFKEINEAYSILGDSVKKSNYNAKYQEYFFKSSSSNTNHSSNSNNFNSARSNSNHHEKNTETNNKRTTSMNKETIEKSKLYNHKLFKYSVFLLAVGIGFLIYKWSDISAYYDNKDKQEQYQLLINSIQQAKTFNNSAIAALKIPKVTLETRWKDNLMYYKLSLLSKSGYQNNSILDSSIKDIYFETRVKAIDKLTANFLDKDGFKIYSLDILISDMTRMVDDGGNVIGYTINSNTPVKPELYKDFDTWELTYTTN